MHSHTQERTRKKANLWKCWKKHHGGYQLLDSTYSKQNLARDKHYSIGFNVLILLSRNFYFFYNPLSPTEFSACERANRRRKNKRKNSDHK